MTEVAGPVAVDILTGFLGAGKTTLLRRLLDKGALEGTAILVNEFAALPIDQRLIGLSGGEVAVLGDRCLCCVVDGNLRATLVGLLERRASGDLPPFTRILIETSGLADPTPLLATLVADPVLKARLRPGRVVTLVDLCHGEATLADSDEALAQIIAADWIGLTKPDLAAPGAAEALKKQLAALNPLARILDFGGTPFDPFSRSDFPDSAAFQRQSHRFTALPAARIRHGEIVATVLRWPRPVDWAVFATWLSLLAHRHGAKLLRVKGTLRLAGGEDKGPILIQSVRHVVHMPEHLPAGAGPDGIELVMILRDIDPALLRRSFEAFLRRAQAEDAVEDLHATG